jgi:cytoskeletal protein CcmA (bactofilin family)
MEQKNRHNLNISGLMGGQGGLYNSVTINGLGKVKGDLDCIDFFCHGTANIDGRFKAQSAEIHGIARIAADCVAKHMKVHGKSTVGGHLSGEEIEIHGFMNVKGNCDAETFHSRGGFRINGLLNAEKIDIFLYAKCKAKEIGGGIIRVQKPGAMSPFQNLIRTILPKFDVLTTDLIEGDEIVLENTRAKVIRGTKVTIGPGCEIDLVEYKEQLQLDKNAKVAESRKV